MSINTPSEPLSVDRIVVGMPVTDAAGSDAGTVSAVQSAGTHVRPDVAAGVAELLMGTGYVRINGTGQLSNDTYAGADQLADVTAGEPGGVALSVTQDKLYRATS